jgi:hypothetical protein
MGSVIVAVIVGAILVALTGYESHYKRKQHDKHFEQHRRIL